MRAESLTDFHVLSPMCYPSHIKPLSPYRFKLSLKCHFLTN